MDDVPVAFWVLKEVKTYLMREGKVKPVFKYVGTHIITEILPTMLD